MCTHNDALSDWDDHSVEKLVLGFTTTKFFFFLNELWRIKLIIILRIATLQKQNQFLGAHLILKPTFFLTCLTKWTKEEEEKRKHGAQSTNID